MEIYFIGGSPCSGKSTVAERIAEQYSMYYFKVDDFLENYLKEAAESGKRTAVKAIQMSSEETWMRDPELQKEEELEIYREIYEYIQRDLIKLQGDQNIITEGAAFLPELMADNFIDADHYFCLIPNREFQYSHYRERSFVPYVLEGCKDKEKAFYNWMERDVLFGEQVQQDSIKYGYQYLKNDGSLSIDKLYQKICGTFGLMTSDGNL